MYVLLVKELSKVIETPDLRTSAKKELFALLVDDFFKVRKLTAIQ